MNISTSAKPVGRVLVVDDEPLNRELLIGVLEGSGHTVLEADSGTRALENLAEYNPDVVLLDVMMPGISGYDVCRQLKASPKTSHIPVLLITALTSRQDRLTGIESGAIDFVTKPVDTQDVLLRVGNAVAMKTQYDQLAESYVSLEQLETLRDSLTHMIVHDMRAPLTATSGFLTALRGRLTPKIPEGELEIIDRVSQNVQSIMLMIDTMLSISKLETDEMPVNLERRDIRDLLTESIEIFKYSANNVTFELELPETPVDLNFDPALLQRVLMNLLQNAIRHSPQSGIVRISTKRVDNQVCILVSDRATPIPAQEREHIFEKFHQIRNADSRSSGSSGLGLAFCRLAVEAHGGKIYVDPDYAEGNTFRIDLPVDPPA